MGGDDSGSGDLVGAGYHERGAISACGIGKGVRISGNTPTPYGCKRVKYHDETHHEVKRSILASCTTNTTAALLSLRLLVHLPTVICSS